MKALEKFLKKLLVQAIGIFRSGKKIQPQELPVRFFKRILIVKQHDQLGDLLMATPAIRAVRKRFPGAHLAVVVRSYTAPMIWENPNIDEVIVFHEKLKEWNWKVLRGFLDQLRQQGGYDCAIMLNTISRSLSSDIIALLSRAKYIIGPDHLSLDPSIPEKIYDVLTHRSEKVQHEIEHNLDIVRSFGVHDDGFEYDLEIDNQERIEAENIFQSANLQNSSLAIGVHFGTLDKTRRFPLKKLAQVIDWLKSHYDCEVVIVVGPNELPLRDQLLGMLKSKVVTAPVMPVRVAAAFIKRLHLFLCNDTGTLHIASAMRVPTVSFHGMNDPAVWKPVHPRHIGVRAADAKITSISVEQVTGALAIQLKDFENVKL
ncbi:MAG: glycosyltransferase family 9 protein [Bacteroidota bacterium]